MKNNKLYISLVLIAFILVNCFKQASEKSPSTIDFSKLPYKSLSEYGFFKGNIHDMVENDDVIPYEPIASLFTDYAFKKRFVWMPENTHASINENDPDATLDFPEHTFLIKNFYYPADFSKPEANRRIIETRILFKREGKWEAFPYKWNNDQTDAELKTIGGIVPVKFTNEKHEEMAFNYAIPNKNQCKSCHYRNNTFSPIGPKPKQLNHEMAYKEGNMNQLEKWVSLGKLKTIAVLDSLPSMVNPMDVKQPLALRARSYLDTNCGHCHSSYGPAATSGLYLNFEEDRPFHLGVQKSPVAAGIGAGTFKFDVNPKKGKESIITYRMNSVHPGIMMPEIGRVTIHKEGVQLIEDWINAL